MSETAAGTSKGFKQKRELEALLNEITDGLLKAFGKFIKLSLSSQCFTSEEVAEEWDPYTRSTTASTVLTPRRGLKTKHKQTKVSLKRLPKPSDETLQYAIDSSESISPPNTPVETDVALGSLTHQMSYSGSESEGSMSSLRLPDKDRETSVSHPSTRRVTRSIANTQTHELDSAVQRTLLGLTPLTENHKMV